MAAYPPEQARTLLAARVRRVRNIRRGVIAGALSAFVLAWGVIAHSGPMGSQSAAASTASTGSGSTSTSSGSSSSSSDGWSQPSSQAWSDGGGQGGVTTAQS
jgi:hypothetical protein